MDESSGFTSEKLGLIIESKSGEIERRWLERVQRDIAGSSEVEPTQLRDGMPDYLIQLAHTLKQDGSSTDALRERGRTAWSQVAQEHGITRVRAGFDVSQLVHEFVLLRRVVYEVVQKEEPAFGRVESVLAELLEAAIGVAVKAYVDARDYDARRSQAENIGFLTHELRQPLATAFVASARLRVQTATAALHVVDRLDRALRRLRDLVDGVLLNEKLEIGEVRVQPIEITLRQLMEPIESLRRTAEQKGLRFSVRYDPELSVFLDPVLTQSVFRNLAENAVKYTDSGEVDIAVSHTTDEIILDVRDTCNGLSPDELRTIFEPFKRGRTEKTGSGLGLAIARRAVESQGGTIYAESPGPSGCHFSVHLPRRLPEVLRYQDAVDGAPSGDPGKEGSSS